MKTNKIIIVGVILWLIPMHAMKRPASEGLTARPHKYAKSFPSLRTFKDRNYYKRLGLSDKNVRSITKEEIESAYNEQLQKMKKENRLDLKPYLDVAYKDLSDPIQKLIYDTKKYDTKKPSSPIISPPLFKVGDVAPQASSISTIQSEFTQENTASLKEIEEYRNASYYERLGLWKDAYLINLSDKQIHDAYDKKLNQLKMQKHGNDKIPLLDEAYATLKDPLKKQFYDERIRNKGSK